MVQNVVQKNHIFCSTLLKTRAAVTLLLLENIRTQ